MQRTAIALPDAPTLEKLISAAVAAPSFHNSQPWRFRLQPETNTLLVRADPGRALQCEDPVGRALHISVGAAVLNLRIAVTHLGWEPVVRLLPHPPEPDLLASIRLAGPRRDMNHDGEHRLYDAIWRRHTSRQPFTAVPVPTEVLTELTEAAHTEGVCLYIPDRDETRRLLSLTAEAERRDVTDPDRRDESRRWINPPHQGATGLPVAALGPLDADGHLPVRDFSALNSPLHKPTTRFEREPRLAVLTTPHDRRADWLRTGQAMERVLLHATAEGLQSSPLHQALEWPDLRWALRAPGRGLEHVQMILRLGYGDPGPTTPRLPAREVLDPPRDP
jgi:nitroreductase